jgi:hypothetical protein
MVARERADIRHIWSRAKDTPRDRLAWQIEQVLGRCSERLLISFYPEAEQLFSGQTVTLPVKSLVLGASPATPETRTTGAALGSPRASGRLSDA